MAKRLPGAARLSAVGSQSTSGEPKSNPSTNGPFVTVLFTTVFDTP